MLKKRPTEPFWVVSREDPEMLTVDHETTRKYLLDRDIKKLPIDFEAKTLNGNPITMFKCLPLSRKAARLLESSSAAVDHIVQTHVTEVVNFQGVDCVQQSDGTYRVSDDGMKALDDDIINELAMVIIETGRGKDGEYRAFSLPGTWLQDRTTSLQLPASLALLDSATITTEQDQDPAQEPPSNSLKN